MIETIRKLINEHFTTGINERLRHREIARSPFRAMAERYKLGNNINDLVGIVPEILTGVLFNKPATKILDFSNPANHETLRDRKGLLLCYSLSPYSESLGLYCDIGRSFRLAKGLGLNIEIIQAGRDWSAFNWVVRDLNLYENLHGSETWRSSLYDKLHLTYSIRGTANAMKNDSTGKKIDEIAQGYAKIVEKIGGEDIADKRFKKHEEDDWLEKAKKSDFQEYTENALLKHVIDPILKTIEIVLRKFHRLDYHTFLYFMLQFYHQSQYHNYLKISMHRERDFDTSFRKIIHSKNLVIAEGAEKESDHLNLIGMYFDDYKYGIGESDEILTAHPYYFPSGSIYHLYGKDLKKAVDNCIMISDFGADKKSKIARILGKTDHFHRARLISDLLSFAHLLGTNYKESRDVIGDWMKKINPIFGNSWDKYTVEGAADSNTFSENCKCWSELIFTPLEENSKIPIPYHFLPFFWTKMERNSVTVEQEAELIILILSEANKNLGLPPIVKGPKP